MVCNNTSVSKEVYKYLAGDEIPTDHETEPPTLLIDNDALKNAESTGPDLNRVEPNVAGLIWS